MSWSRSAAIVRHELRIIRNDFASWLTLAFMPLIMIAFLSPIARLSLQDAQPGASGADYSVPAMATLFAFFLIGHIGFSFFMEKQWHTWERLRASPAGNIDIMVGKVVPAFLLAATQQVFLFGAGAVVFGMRIRGSVLALAAVVAALCIALTALGILAASLFKNSQQLNVFTNLGAMLLAGISGAFVPIELLPAWARALSPIAPQYWALRGYREVIMDGAGPAAVLLPVVVLLGIAVAATFLSLMRFRFDEPEIRAVKVAAAA